MRTLVLATLAACGGPRTPETSGPVPPAAPQAPAPRPSLTLEGIELPADAATLREPVWTRRARWGGAPIEIGFHTLFRTGDRGIGEMYSTSGADLGEVCEEQDFDSLLVAGGRPWLVSHFECVPGATWVTALTQGPDGALTAGDSHPVDWSAWGGIWYPCSGQVSPWGTHLGSEEYEPDARQWKPDGTFVAAVPDDWKSFSRYLGTTVGDPYRYGWPLELSLDDQGRATPEKHYAMGRFSHELSYVLPDRRTVYQSDDGTGVGLFLFVADEAGNLDAGTLYAARFETRDAAVTTTWVSLGHATQDQIAALVDRGPSFSELFEVAEPGADHACPAGFTYTHHAYGRECLKLAAPSERVPDPALAASRLEARRYAAMRGATTELEKTEGLTYDPESGTVYLSVSSIRHRMLAEPGEPHDGLRIEQNRCGAVWGGTTGAKVTDTDGAPIDSDHVIVEMRAAVAGVQLAEPDAAGNGCDPASIANPDNLTFLPGQGLLTIAEDTKWRVGHLNAVLWSMDVKTGQRQRLIVAPPGGELTGIHWIPDLLGHGYLTAVVQHPWDELEDGQPVPDGVTEQDRRAFTGYVGPFPALTP